MIPQMFLEAVCLALVAATISCTLIVAIPNEPIVAWWFKFGNWIGAPVVNGWEKQRWFYKFIWGCEKCFAGQLAFWLYLHYHTTFKFAPSCSLAGDLANIFTLGGYSIPFHLFSVFLAIITAMYFSQHIKSKF